MRDTSKPNRPPRRKLDTTRAQERFGFEATARFEEGLRATIRWYEQVRARVEVDEVYIIP